MGLLFSLVLHMFRLTLEFAIYHKYFEPGHKVGRIHKEISIKPLYQCYRLQMADHGGKPEIHLFMLP